MSNAGQAALTIVGTAIGAYFGYPQLGFALGSLAGQLAFPTKIGTPSVSDLHYQGASEGDPIKLVYGTARITGNLIWADSVHKNSSGGKSAGPVVQTWSYTQSFAIQLCAGPIAGIRRIWMDKTLVYDISENASPAMQAQSDAVSQHFALYLGTESQLPDPTMQAVLGAANVPAHRGYAYIVFNALDITKFGPRIPVIEVEIASAVVQTTKYQYSNQVLYPWSCGHNPMNGLNTHSLQKSPNRQQNFASFTGPDGTSGTSYTSLATAISDTNAALNGRSLSYIGWTAYINDTTGLGSATYNASIIDLVNNTGMTCGEQMTLYLHYNLYPAIAWFSPSYGPIANWIESQQEGAMSWSTNGGTSGVSYGAVGYWSHFCYFDDHNTQPSLHLDDYAFFIQTGNNNLLGYNVCSGFYNKTGVALYECLDSIITVARTPSAPLPTCQGLTPLPENPNWCVDANGNMVRALTWTYVTTGGPYKVLAQYTTGAGTVNGVNTTVVTQYPLNPCLAPSDPNYNSQSYWTAAYNAVAGKPVSQGGMPAGLVYGTNYPVTQSWAYQASYQVPTAKPAPTTVGAVVSSVCLKAGLTSGQIDVTQLNSTSIWGVGISRVVSGKDLITSLQPYGLFDAAETAGTIRFVSRGAAAAAALADDDLGAEKDIQGGKSRLTVRRVQDVDLPLVYRLHYADQNNYYLDGQVDSKRQVTTTVATVDVGLPVAMPSDKAAQLADINMRAAWIAREQYAFTCNASWLGVFKAADPITITAQSVSRRVRVKAIEYEFPGLLNVAAERDEVDAYTSVAVGPNSGSAGTATPAGTVISLQGPANLVILDIPVLRSQDSNAGVYGALYGLTSGWSGATVFRSVDGGNNYIELLTATKTGTVGKTTTALAAGWPVQFFDPNETLTVKLTAGTVSSTTLNGLFNNANVAAVGADGRWEIIQFLTATQNADGSYTLSGLLRGVLGSAPWMGTGLVGDTFVLLTGNIVRLNDSLSYKGVAELYKAVSSGTSTTNTATVGQTPQEVCLRPLAPVMFNATANATGDVAFTWTRQDRLANDLVAGSDVPMSETSELYSLEIYTDSTFTTVARTLSSTVTSLTYFAVNQVQDFGANQKTVNAIVYQVSSSVGRGYGTKGTFNIGTQSGFDPARSAPGGGSITLSNGNLTAALSAVAFATSPFAGSSVYRKTGKLYFEMTTSVFSPTGTGPYASIGLASATVTNVSSGGYLILFAINSDGNTIVSNASGPQTGLTYNSGPSRTVQIAIDFANALAWVGVDNVWYGNPGAGTGGIAISFSNMPVAPAVTCNSAAGNNPNVTVTLATKQQFLKFPPPRGFTTWE